MNKHFSYEYARPAVTATVMLLHYDKVDKRHKYLIGKRSKSSDAYPEHFCLPGGFLDAKTSSFHGESVKQAAVREVLEETNILISEKSLKIVDEYSDPKIDPRGHTVNIVFLSLINDEQLKSAKAGDDIQSLDWIDIYDDFNNESLAFNHGAIISDCLNRFSQTSK